MPVLTPKTFHMSVSTAIEAADGVLLHTAKLVAEPRVGALAMALALGRLCRFAKLDVRVLCDMVVLGHGSDDPAQAIVAHAGLRQEEDEWEPRRTRPQSRRRRV